MEDTFLVAVHKQFMNWIKLLQLNVSNKLAIPLFISTALSYFDSPDT